MDIPNNSWGICITCKHRPYCLSFQNGLRAERPIWDCYEYEHNDTEEVDNPYWNRPKVSRIVNSSDEITVDRSKGLCMNCANRSSCKFPIPKGGVWHCEEYC
jgi:hypothetical protein